MRALVMKELRQAWRSFRLPAFYLVLLFLAVSDPLAARYMGEVLQRLARGITIVMPPPTPVQALQQFFGDIAEIGILVLIAVTMGSVAGERVTGVTTFMVTKPVSRLSYLASKLIVMAVGSSAGIVAAAVVAAAYTRTLLGPVSPGQVALATVASVLFVEFIMVITLTASMVAPSQLAAGGAGLAGFLMTGVLGSLLGGTALGPYLPSALLGLAARAFSEPTGSAVLSDLAKSGAVTVGLAVALFAAGCGRFKAADLP